MALNLSNWIFQGLIGGASKPMFDPVGSYTQGALSALNLQNQQMAQQMQGLQNQAVQNYYENPNDTLNTQRLFALRPEFANAMTYARNTDIQAGLNAAKLNAIQAYQNNPSIENLRILAATNANPSLVAQLTGLSTSGGVDAAVQNATILGAEGRGLDPLSALPTAIEEMKKARTSVTVNPTGDIGEIKGIGALGLRSDIANQQNPNVVMEGDLAKIVPTLQPKNQSAKQALDSMFVSQELPLPTESQQNLGVTQDAPSDPDLVVGAAPVELPKGQMYEQYSKQLDDQLKLGNDAYNEITAANDVGGINDLKLNNYKEIGSLLSSGATTEIGRTFKNGIFQILESAGISNLTPDELNNISLEKFAEIAKTDNILKAAEKAGARAVDSNAEKTLWAKVGVQPNDELGATIKVINKDVASIYKNQKLTELANEWQTNIGNLKQKNANGMTFQQWSRKKMQEFLPANQTLYDKPEYLNFLQQNNIPVILNTRMADKYRELLPEGITVYNSNTGKLYRKNPKQKNQPMFSLISANE